MGRKSRFEVGGTVTDSLAAHRLLHPGRCRHLRISGSSEVPDEEPENHQRRRVAVEALSVTNGLRGHAPTLAIATAQYDGFRPRFFRKRRMVPGVDRRAFVTSDGNLIVRPLTVDRPVR